MTDTKIVTQKKEEKKEKKGWRFFESFAAPEVEPPITDYFTEDWSRSTACRFRLRELCRNVRCVASVNELLAPLGTTKVNVHPGTTS